MTRYPFCCTINVSQFLMVEPIHVNKGSFIPFQAGIDDKDNHSAAKGILLKINLFLFRLV